MKRPRTTAFRAPKLPVSGALKRALAQAGTSAFAYHPPATGEARTPARMHRPKGGHGPHNPGD